MINSYQLSVIGYQSTANKTFFEILGEGVKVVRGVKELK